MKMLTKAKDIITQIPGWRTNQKLVVFQSDDWGSVRMPSKSVYENLLSKGLSVNDSYNKYDSVESDEDLEFLFDTLLKFRDSHGNHPCITANCLLANPDFEKIEKEGFSRYIVEPVSETFKRYNKSDTIENYWKKGNSQNIFSLQFHGREHLNIQLWMNALRSGNKDAIEAFKLGAFGIYAKTGSQKRKHFLAAFDFGESAEINGLNDILLNGLDLFESQLGFKSESFIPPNYVFNRIMEPTLKKKQVKFFQTQRFQIEPVNDKAYKTVFRYTGQRSTNGLTFLVRNCHFEPCEDPNKDWVSSCLSDIDLSFRLKKPAIISTHRVNFIGRINSTRRDTNLKLFSSLVKSIIEKWPDVEFLSTSQLGNNILHV